jgi:uncharacterized protein
MINACLAGDAKPVSKAIYSNRSAVRTLDTCGWTPLMCAALGDHKEVVSVLLEAKAPIDAVAPTGETALHLAARQGSVDVMSLLIDHGAAVEARDGGGMTPLLRAAAMGQARAVKRLMMDHGADVDSRDSCGRSAWELAAHAEFPAVLQTLVMIITGIPTCILNDRRLCNTLQRRFGNSDRGDMISCTTPRP